MPESGQEIWRHFKCGDYPKMLERLGLKLERIWRAKGFEDPEIRLRLLVEEAVNNAWEHGNKKNPDLAITITWNFDRNFFFSVEDQGPGFRLENLPDPVSDEGLEGARGRGVFLIKHYSREARWEKGGRKLSFHLEPKASPHCQRETDFDQR